MNRKLNLTAPTVGRIIGALGRTLGKKEKKLIAEHKAKVYLILDGESMEAHFIDLDMKGEDTDGKTEGA